MIGFRYHLVSLVAVFLALAVGLVLGSVVLDEPLVRAAAERNAALRDERGDLAGQARDLRAQLETERRFTREITPALVADRLAGESVLVVVAPGVEATIRRDAVDLVDQAGGTLTGTLTLRPAYADPAQAESMDALVARLVPPGVRLPSGTAQERAAVELASVLMAPPAPADEEAGPTGSTDARRSADDARTSVLTGFAEMGLLEGSASVDRPASLALVLAPTPDGSETLSTSVTTLAQALGERGAGAVVAGPSASARGRGVLAAVRTAARPPQDLSTVDTLGTSAGAVTVTYALAEQTAGDGGHYGRGPGATALLPRP